MKFRKIILAAALALPIAGLTTGCLKKPISTTSPTVNNNFYGQASLVLNNFSNILLQSQQLFTTAHSLSLVSNEDYVSGQKVFAQIATSGDSIQVLLKSGADQKTVTAQIQALINQVGTMPAAFSIKNPSSQAEFTALVTAMQNVLGASLTLINQ